MDLTLPIPQTIGYEYGAAADGVLVGQVNHVNAGAQAYYTYAHQVLYAATEQDDSPVSPSVIWTAVEDNFNSTILTNTSPFAPAAGATAYGLLYLAVRPGITGFTFNVLTPGVGSFTVEADYSTATGYSPLTSAVFSTNFMKTGDLNTLKFTAPTDWATTTIGVPTPAQKWIRLKIHTGGTISVQPVVDRVWENSATPTISSGGHSDPPFYNPYNNLLPITGDKLYLSTPYIPYTLQLTYTRPMESGSVNYVYSKADGTFGTLTPVWDTTVGLTQGNFIMYTAHTLEGAGGSSAATTAQGILGDGLAYLQNIYLPGGAYGEVSLGFSTANDFTAPITSLQANANGGDPKYAILVNGVVDFLTDVTPVVGDYMQILRYDGKIYYFVNGINVAPNYTPIVNHDLLYLGVWSSGSTVRADFITFCDWTNRTAEPLAITWNVIGTFFTDTPVATGNYFITDNYISFLPPADFAPLTALQSPTGQAGYVIGLITNMGGSPGVPTTWITPLTLNFEKFLTLNAPGNIYFPTGQQASVQTFNMDLATPEGIASNTSFFVIMQTASTPQIRYIECDIPNVGNIWNRTFTRSGISSVIVQQVKGDAASVVGAPSFLYLGS
jgi:hypothetical protein